MTKPAERPTIAVIGGGVTGLVASDLLAGRGHRVVLLEAGDRLGGKILTERLDGITVEAGPDSFLAREPWAVELCRDVGLGDRLVEPALFGAHVWTAGGLRKLPPDFTFGMPSSPMRALRSGLLSPWGALRAGADLVLPGPLEGPDVSIGSFVTRRFGSEVLERLVDPLLAGTRAGRAEDLSLAAAAPQIDALARAHRSVIVGLRAARRAGGAASGPPPFLGLGGGMQTLVDRLEQRLAARGAEVHTGTTVERLGPAPDGSYVVQPPAEQPLRARAVVIAAPAHGAAKLLEEVNPCAAHALAGIEYASVVTVTLVYDAGAGSPPVHGSGMLVPSSAGKTLAACSWYSTKWPQHVPGDGRVVVRCFVGRAAGDASATLSDGELVGRLAAELGAAAGLHGAPTPLAITRWDRALPQYAVGHLERIARAEQALAATPGIALAGAGYRGSGLPDCIKSAHAAVRLIETALVRR
jgi:protoporphyrinogen/coproporphyrinogen III oxidase